MGLLYQLFDYPFVYLLYQPQDKRAVVLVDDGLYMLRSRHPRLRIFPDDPIRRSILIVLPFWIYPSRRLLRRAKRLLRIDKETTAKIFRYAESYPVEKFDDYCISKMEELANENTNGMLEIIEEAEQCL
jgi:hypothetical protein